MKPSQLTLPFCWIFTATALGCTVTSYKTKYWWQSQFPTPGGLWPECVLADDKVVCFDPYLANGAVWAARILLGVAMCLYSSSLVMTIFCIFIPLGWSAKHGARANVAVLIPTVLCHLLTLILYGSLGCRGRTAWNCTQHGLSWSFWFGIVSLFFSVLATACASIHVEETNSKSKESKESFDYEGDSSHLHRTKSGVYDAEC